MVPAEQVLAELTRPSRLAWREGAQLLYLRCKYLSASI